MDAMRDMIRISRKAVILLEMHGETVRKYRGEFHPPGNWKRNYRRIFRELGISDDTLTIEPVSEELWSPSGGGAAYIEARLT